MQRAFRFIWRYDPFPTCLLLETGVEIHLYERRVALENMFRRVVVWRNVFALNWNLKFLVVLNIFWVNRGTRVWKVQFQLLLRLQMAVMGWCVSLLFVNFFEKRFHILFVVAQPPWVSHPLLYQAVILEWALPFLCDLLALHHFEVQKCLAGGSVLLGDLSLHLPRCFDQLNVRWIWVGWVPRHGVLIISIYMVSLRFNLSERMIFPLIPIGINEVFGVYPIKVSNLLEVRLWDRHEACLL